jgi:hypothetical protein
VNQDDIYQQEVCSVKNNSTGQPTDVVVEMPYAYAAAFNSARVEFTSAFQAGAAWRQDPAAIAGYSGGFNDGWHARDAEVARLLAALAPNLAGDVPG